MLTELQGGATRDEGVPDVPVEHLDYAYIDKCEDVKELKNILEVLQSGKEGRWPKLERHAEERLVPLLPAKERRLFLAQREEPSPDEVDAVRGDLANFLSEISRADEKLRARTGNQHEPARASSPDPTAIFEDEPASMPRGEPHLPPVRGSAAANAAACAKPNISRRTPEEVARDEAKRKAKEKQRISAYDFRAWDKFDVDQELERIDAEEQLARQRQEEETRAKQQAIDERKKRTEEAKAKSSAVADRVQSLTEEQRVFFSTREKEKGNECFKAGEFEDALRFYSKSIDLLPPSSLDARPFANRAMANLKLERWEQAEEDCDEAIRRDASFGKAYARRGMARHRRGKYLDAIDDFEEALQHEPQNAKLNALLAESRKKYNEVGGLGADRPNAPPRAGGARPKETFRKLMIIEDSDDDDDDDDAGDDGEGDDGAKEEDEEAVEIPSNETVAPETAAVEAPNPPEPAEAAQEPHAETSSESAEPAAMSWVEYKRKGAEFFKQGELKEALAMFSRAVDALRTTGSEPEHLCNCLGNLAVCYKGLGQWQDVVETCDEVISLDEGNIKALFRRGVAYEELGHLEPALNDMCQVLRLDPERTEAGDRISTLMGRMSGEQEPAASDPPVAVVPEACGAKTGELLKDEGNALFKEGRLAEALEKYRASLAVSPANPAVLGNCAMVHLKLGAFAACVADCGAGLDLVGPEPATPKLATLRVKLLYRRASAQRQQGNHLAAVDDLEQVLAAEPGNARAAAELRELRNALAAAQRQEEEKARLAARQAKQREADALTERAKAKAKEHAASSALPPKPKARYEFERAWRAMGSEQRGRYLASFPARHLAKLFKVELPEDTLLEIVACLHEHHAGTPLAADVLEHLSAVDRFSTTLRFLSAAQRAEVEALLATLGRPDLHEAYSKPETK